MKIEHEHDESGGRFNAVDGENRLGTLEYALEGKTMRIDHTIVDQGNEGKGIGKDLVMAAADYAKNKSMKVNPVCSYAKSVFEKNDELKELVETNPSA